MKRKLLITILAVVSVITCAFGFTACKAEDKNIKSSNNNAADSSNGSTIEASYATAVELGYNGTLEEFIASISGKDGTSIVSTILNNDGELIIVLSNGTVQNLGKIVGEDGANGKDGVGVANAYLDNNGNLIIELTNGKIVNCGSMVYDSERLLYSAIKEDNEIIGYSVRGLGTVSDADLIIPSAYNGKPVLSLAAGAFANSTHLTSVTIPDSVTLIGEDAFSGCTLLESISVDKYNAIYSSRNGILYNKNETQIILVPKALKEIVLSDNLTAIGSGAFSACAIVSVTIPAGITSIGDMAFSMCLALEEINYGGTSDQWNALSKGFNWNYNTGNYIVYCNDGVVLDKSGNVIYA